MSITDLGNDFQFIGGLGMFLYGMGAMADGLQKFAGNRPPEAAWNPDNQPVPRRSGGSGRHGYYSEQFRNYRHGSRLCQCRNY